MTDVFLYALDFPVKVLIKTIGKTRDFNGKCYDSLALVDERFNDILFNARSLRGIICHWIDTTNIRRRTHIVLATLLLIQ